MTVHDKSSAAGKFDFGFMGEGKDDDKPTEKSKQPSGSYPLAEGREEAYAKPTHADGTLITRK
jgi:hypothetical protein